MGQFHQDGDMVKMGHFLFFWSSVCDQAVWLFDFSTPLKRFCRGHSKNVLVLAHPEPRPGEIDPYVHVHFFNSRNTAGEYVLPASRSITLSSGFGQDRKNWDTWNDANDQ